MSERDDYCELRAQLEALRKFNHPVTTKIADAFGKFFEVRERRELESMAGALDGMLTKLSGGDTLAALEKAIQRQQDLSTDETFALGMIILAIRAVREMKS